MDTANTMRVNARSGSGPYESKAEPCGEGRTTPAVDDLHAASSLSFQTL
jgi:hypothetical protein